MNREILLNAKGFLGDILLDPPPPSLTPRQTEGPYRELAKSLAKFGYDLRTSKTLRQTPVAEIHVNVQPVVRRPSFLLRMESGFVVPENDDLTKLHRYLRVFTWDQVMAQREGFDWVHHPQDPPLQPLTEWPDFDQRDRFSCLIATNKSMRRRPPIDLYLERQQIIQWYESRAPQYFDLFGRHWDRPMTNSGLSANVLRLVAKLGFLRSSLITYKGQLPDKALALRRTKFNFALENVAGLSGYLTEKLFDTLYEGCMPIYWGDPKVETVLPADLYLKYWEFDSLDALYEYLMSVGRDGYHKFQTATREFLASEKMLNLSSRNFSEKVAKIIFESLNKGD